MLHSVWAVFLTTYVYGPDKLQHEIPDFSANLKTEPSLLAADCTAEAIAAVMHANNDKIAVLSDDGVFDVMAGLYTNAKSQYHTTVSRITDKALPAAKEWQQRPLESVYDISDNTIIKAVH